MLLHMLLRHDVIVLTNDPIEGTFGYFAVAGTVRPEVDRMESWWSWILLFQQIIECLRFSIFDFDIEKIDAKSMSKSKTTPIPDIDSS